MFISIAQVNIFDKIPTNNVGLWQPTKQSPGINYKVINSSNSDYKIADPNINSKTQTNSIFKKYVLKNANVAFSNDVIETTPNNYVTIGQTYDTIGTQLHWRLTLTGIDQNYNLSWKKGYGSNSFNYTHNLFAPMHFIRKNNFLYSAIIVEDSNYKQPGVFIKFNFNGDTIWQKKYYVNNDLFTFSSVCPSIDNGFLITGAVQTNTPGYNNHPIVATYLLKTDADGNKLWDKRFYKQNLDYAQAGYSILQDSITKKIIIVGYQDGISQQYSNLQILDSLGNLIAQRGSNGSFGNALCDVIKLKDGNYVTVGVTNHSEFLINGTATGASTLIKFDQDGFILYKKEFDSLVVNNVFNKVLEMADGNIITGGTLMTGFQYNMGINDISRIMKIDKNGNLLWKKYFDNYTNYANQDGLSGMILTSDGNIAFTNYLNGGNVPRPLNYSFYKTDTSFCDVNSIGCYTYVGLKENELKKQNLKIYPNPATNFCIINLSQLQSYKTITIEVKNALGQLIFRTLENTILDYNLNINSYKEGFYFITISQNSQLIAEQKLIILK